MVENLNETLKTIFSRKSCRKFTSEPVSKEDIDILLRAAMAGPSAKNVQPWRFIVVDNREFLDTMAEGLPYAKMLKTSPLAIVVCGDLTPMTPAKQYNDLWDQDCSIAAENLLLAAESLGLGAVWTAVYPYKERIEVVSPLLGIPEGVLPLCVIPIGHPENPDAPAKDKYKPENIHYNKW